MEVDSELEAWKIAVVRASSYVQSNASFQIQMFGFYISAIVIGYGISTPANQPVLLRVIVPLLSLCVLYASCFYFNRLTVQHVFIRMYGHKFDKSAKTKSSDQLWSDLKEASPIPFRKSAKYLFTSDYTGPYPLFFLSYNIIGLSSFLYSMHPEWGAGVVHNVGLIFAVAAYGLCAGSISFWLTARLTSRAWKAMSFEDETECRAGPRNTQA